MAKIGQPTIPSDTAHDIDACVAIADRIGYPVIIRPAFTLGGGGGGVAYNEAELREKAAVGLDYSPITQVLIEKYIFGWMCSREKKRLGSMRCSAPGENRRPS